MRRLSIALDFDETISADPVFWSQFISLAQAHKHKVTIVTFRFEDDPDNDDIESFSSHNEVAIVYCNAKQKSTCFEADIWIDDYPLLIPAYAELVKMRIGCERNDETA